METISNKFFVQVIEDGASLHGELRATKSLTQSYSGSACIPDWTVSANRPVIYLSLMNGTSYVTPDEGFKWYYNGTEIEFDSNGSSTEKTYGGYTLSAGTFVKTTYTLSGRSMPALQIANNLASSSNVDIDVIRFDGQLTLSTNPISFTSAINVTITSWVEGGGYLGVISFRDGIADIDSTNTSVTCQAELYNSSGSQVTSGVTYKWYFEGEDDPAQNSTNPNFTVSDSDVVDYAVVRCEYWMTIDGTDTCVAVARVGIDDTQDPEYMWIQYNGANGNSASLRTGESVVFTAWVGKAGDPSYVNTSYTDFKVKLIDSTGTVITASLTPTFEDPDSTGYRTLPVSSNKTTLTITFDLASTYARKGLTGIILASTSA